MVGSTRQRLDGWFASATDICRVYASLADLARRPRLAGISHALSISDDGLDLNRRQWPSVWFKGGWGGNVLNVAYLATNRTGRTYSVIVLTENPAAPIDEATAPPILVSAVKGAFALAAR